MGLSNNPKQKFPTKINKILPKPMKKKVKEKD